MGEVSMIFNEIIGLENIPENEHVIYREAVRAVAFNFINQVVMIESSRGDYQFPGGGIDVGEEQLETLRREALEEAAIVIKESVQQIGVMEESRKSLEVEGAYFVMKSTYYLCHVESYADDTQLEEYEKAMGFTPVEIEIEEAYKRNLKVLQQPDQGTPWIERDTLVLKYLLDNKAKLLEIGGV